MDVDCNITSRHELIKTPQERRDNNNIALHRRPQKRGLGSFTIFVDQCSSQVLKQCDAVLLQAKSLKHRDYDQK